MEIKTTEKSVPLKHQIDLCYIAASVALADLLVFWKRNNKGSVNIPTFEQFHQYMLQLFILTEPLIEGGDTSTEWWRAWLGKVDYRSVNVLEAFDKFGEFGKCLKRNGFLQVGGK